MKENILSEDFSDLTVLMKGGLKPEYYIRKSFFLNFWPSSKWLKNDPYHVLTFLYWSNGRLIFWWWSKNQDFVLAYIEDFVGHWGRSLFGDLENGGQAAAEHVGRLFEMSKKVGC